MNGRIGCCDKGVGGRPNTISGSDAESFAGRLEGTGGAVGCDTMGGPHIGGDCRLEPRDHWSLGQPIRAEDCDYRFDVVV